MEPERGFRGLGRRRLCLGAVIGVLLAVVIGVGVHLGLSRTQATTGSSASAAAMDGDTAMFRAGPCHSGVYPAGGPQPVGELAWSFLTGGEVFSSPAVADGVVYFGSFDHHLYALDAKTGEERWSFETDGAVLSSPAVCDGVVYFGSDDGCLYAFE